MRLLESAILVLLLSIEAEVFAPRVIRLFVNCVCAKSSNSEMSDSDSVASVLYCTIIIITFPEEVRLVGTPY